MRGGSLLLFVEGELMCRVGGGVINRREGRRGCNRERLMLLTTHIIDGMTCSLTIRAI